MVSIHKNNVFGLPNLDFASLLHPCAQDAVNPDPGEWPALRRTEKRQKTQPKKRTVIQYLYWHFRKRLQILSVQFPAVHCVCCLFCSVNPAMLLDFSVGINNKNTKKNRLLQAVGGAVSSLGDAKPGSILRQRVSSGAVRPAGTRVGSQSK